MTLFVHREIEIFVYLTFNTEARKEQTLECGNQNVCSFVLEHLHDIMHFDAHRDRESTFGSLAFYLLVFEHLFSAMIYVSHYHASGHV